MDRFALEAELQQRVETMRKCVEMKRHNAQHIHENTKTVDFLRPKHTVQFSSHDLQIWKESKARDFVNSDVSGT